MKTAFIGGTVIDGTDGKARSNITLEVDDGRIVQIGEGLPPSDNARVIDISGKTVMPGIIDTHVHFAPWGQWLQGHPNDRLFLLVSRSIQAMGAYLACGVTSARDFGGLDAGFCQGIEQGLIVGPRLQTAVCIIEPTNGVLDALPKHVGPCTSELGQSTAVQGMPTPYADGPWDVRAKVREVLRAGADIIKTATSSCRLNFHGHHHLRPFTDEEVEALVDETHRVGKKVSAHAMEGDTITQAVMAGVDGIEHGTITDDETLAEMAERGQWLCPTLWIFRFHIDHEESSEGQDMFKRYYDGALDTVARARKAGVRIVMGSDGGEHDPDRMASVLELQYMIDAGMSPQEVIVSATRDAAESMDIADETGTLETGKSADLLILDGNPLEDMSVVSREQHRQLVMKQGTPYGGCMVEDALGPWAQA